MTFPQVTESGRFIQGIWPVAQCGERPESYMCFAASQAVRERRYLACVICHGLHILEGREGGEKEQARVYVHCVVIIIIIHMLFVSSNSLKES